MNLQTTIEGNNSFIELLAEITNYKSEIVNYKYVKFIGAR